MTTPSREAVGQRFDPALMQRARERSWTALHGIRERMHPGISEAEAKLAAAEVFKELGCERLWHPVLIRIGANTVKTYRQPSDPNLRLGENDSYFIDLGLVFDGHEGDVGDTFVVGHAPEQQACADAARALFGDVADAWRTQGLSGQALYAFAGERAEAMGWRLNMRSRATGSAITRMRSTRAEISASWTRRRPAACGYWRSRLPTRTNRSAPSTRICSIRRRLPESVPGQNLTQGVAVDRRHAPPPRKCDARLLHTLARRARHPTDALGIAHA